MFRSLCSLQFSCALRSLRVDTALFSYSRFCVNDIITGWVEIEVAKRKMNAMFVDLIRKEEFIFSGFCS